MSEKRAQKIGAIIAISVLLLIGANLGYAVINVFWWIVTIAILLFVFIGLPILVLCLVFDFFAMCCAAEVRSPVIRFFQARKRRKQALQHWNYDPYRQTWYR